MPKGDPEYLVLCRASNVRYLHKLPIARLRQTKSNLRFASMICLCFHGSRHASVVKRLNNLLAAFVHGSAIVCVQVPLRLAPHSEPEPDLMLLTPRADFYSEAHPVAEDVLLLIEVCDTTVRYDREVKLPLYARHGVAEVWLGS